MIVERIDKEIEARSVLKHPFYQAWSNGQLSLDALRGYAKEYYYLVKHIPAIVESIASSNSSKDIQTNLKEEKEHVALWVRFANSLDISKDELEAYEPSSKVKDAVDMLLKLAGGYMQGVAAMYAYEAELPKISSTKLEGLIKYYNLSSEDATEYHKVHSIVDVRHAAVWRSILREAREDEAESIYNAAVSSLIAQNLLLDGVYERYMKCN